MPNSLTGSSPAATYKQILHTGAGNLESGTRMRLGDGTATGMFLDAHGIGSIAPNGQIVRFVDRLGVLPANAEKTSFSSVPSAFGWNNDAALPPGSYRLTGCLLAQSSHQPTGINFAFVGSGIDGHIGWLIPGHSSSVSAFGAPFINSSSISTSPFLVQISGILQVGAGATMPSILHNPTAEGVLAKIFSGSWIEMQKYI